VPVLGEEIFLPGIILSGGINCTCGDCGFLPSQEQYIIYNFNKIITWMPFLRKQESTGEKLKQKGDI
jgi:hypothetical protein